MKICHVGYHFHLSLVDLKFSVSKYCNDKISRESENSKNPKKSSIYGLRTQTKHRNYGSNRNYFWLVS